MTTVTQGHEGSQRGSVFLCAFSASVFFYLLNRISAVQGSVATNVHSSNAVGNIKTICEIYSNPLNP